MQWLKKDFLGYLDQWELSVQARGDEFKAGQKKMMMLSGETLTGIRITGIYGYCSSFIAIIIVLMLVNAFVELVEFVFTIPDVEVFLSNKLCQDPIEIFFGQQRQRGRVHDNPNVCDFLKNTQALRVVNGACKNIRGNCRGSDSSKSFVDMNEPLPKRRKVRNK